MTKADNSTCFQINCYQETQVNNVTSPGDASKKATTFSLIKVRQSVAGGITLFKHAAGYLPQIKVQHKRSKRTASC